MNPSMAPVGNSVRLLFCVLVSLILLILVRFLAIPEEIAKQHRLLRLAKKMRAISTKKTPHQFPSPNPNPIPSPPAKRKHPDSHPNPVGTPPRTPGNSALPEAVHLRKPVPHPKPAAPLPPRTPLPGELALEEVWNVQNRQHKVCRIHHACIRPNGTIVVPPWLRGRGLLLAHCGVHSAEVMRDLSAWDASGPFAGGDLFGLYMHGLLVPARKHIPHFATDVLPHAYAAELLRPTFSRGAPRHYGCTARRGARCAARATEARLRPLLFAADGVAARAPGAWERQLLHLLPGPPGLAAPRGLFRGGAGLACFRSVVAHARHYRRNGPVRWYGEGSALGRGGLTRRSVRRRARRRGRAQGCGVRVVVLNRDGARRHVGFRAGREIANARALRAGIASAARARPWLQAKVTEVRFEGVSFQEQVQTMQGADVLVGAHGAGLGNMIFLREHAALVEIFPFGYYAGPFQQIAEAIHLSYRSVDARPDDKPFLDCLRRHIARGTFPMLARNGARMWHDAVRRWRKTGERGLHAHMITDRERTPMKFCARVQRLYVDVEHTAGIVMAEIDTVCGRGTHS